MPRRTRPAARPKAGTPRIGSIGSAWSASAESAAPGPARAAYQAPGFRPGMPAVPHHGHAVHEHVADPGRELMGPLEGRVIDDGRRVEDHHVRTHSLP